MSKQEQYDIIGMTMIGIALALTIYLIYKTKK